MTWDELDADEHKEPPKILIHSKPCNGCGKFYRTCEHLEYGRCEECAVKSYPRPARKPPEAKGPEFFKPRGKDL